MPYDNLYPQEERPPQEKPGLWRRIRRWEKARRWAPAFWTTVSLISLAVNAVLIAGVLLLARDIFTLKQMVADNLVGGLYTNFEKMDQAHIVTSITVSDTLTVKDTIPVVFTLPVKQDTTVVLVEDTLLNNTTIYLNGAPVPLNLVLPKGTELGLNLDIEVPVSQTVPVELKVPVNLQVPVDIALDQTDLHAAFSGLKGVVEPYYRIAADMPSTWEELSFCGPASNWFCRWFFNEE